MSYQFPFGRIVNPVVQKDQTPKKVFVLGVYASAVHAKWIKNNRIICKALAVASEPCIFWDGNLNEAKKIIDKIKIPNGQGRLEPASSHLNGPSAKVLENKILAPLGFTRSDAWLCDCLPETRLNPGQLRFISNVYNKYVEDFGFNKVTIPKRPTNFCNEERAEEIIAELIKSEAQLLVLLGDIPIKQFLKKVANIQYASLQEYVKLYGYGSITEATINGKILKVLPLAHPRQIGALGSHSKKWYEKHEKWVEGESIKTKDAYHHL